MCEMVGEVRADKAKTKRASSAASDGMESQSQGKSSSTGAFDVQLGLSQ